ncbi:MAG: hypothetical protein JJU24_13460 [Natronohydrobacter sp.]|nr:hypothetical protein [Natronohydrobacter sp.]
MSLHRYSFSSATNLRFGRDKAKRKASIRECLACALSTSPDPASAALDAQDFSEAYPKEAAVMAANSSLVKHRPVLLEQAALPDIMKMAR